MGAGISMLAPDFFVGMKSSMRRFGARLAILMIPATLAVGAWLVYRAVVSDQVPSDATAQFLARHWAQPVAPQGAPPPDFAAREASLAPESCGTCHASQYADWRTSLHSRSIGPGILWQFRVLSQDESNSCLRCHAPLAEQKALTALQHGWANAPQDPVPSYVSSDLHLRGLVCAACHVRRHQYFGPPANSRNTLTTADLNSAPRQPHNGFVAERAFQDSRFCSTCHQFPPQGRSLAGKLIENTYEEWRASPAALQGLSCQGCHMPDRRHLWRGVHDRDMVANGLRRELEVKRLDASSLAVQAIISAPGVGHFFPTYVVPKVTVSLHLRDATGTREIARHMIGRMVSVDMDRELSDTRIPPGGRATVSAQVKAPPGEYHVEMHIEVAPAEHYARMFQSMLDRNPHMAPDTRSILRVALREAQAATYRLEDLAVAAPIRLDEARRAVAN